MTALSEHDDPRLARWRLILGGGECDGTGCSLQGRYAQMDTALAQLYGQGKGDPDGDGKNRRGGTEASMPNVSRWLGDIRSYFPASVVEVMQHDAIDRVGIHKLLTEPEFLDIVQADVHLVATLLSLRGVIPNETKNTARIVVKKVIDDLMKRLNNPTRQAIQGALNRAIRNRRPRHNEIDWNRTIRANLKHYQRDYRTVIPETLIGYGFAYRAEIDTGRGRSRAFVLCRYPTLCSWFSQRRDGPSQGGQSQ